MLANQKKEQMVSISLTDIQINELITKIIEYRTADPDTRVLPDLPVVAHKIIIMSNTMLERSSEWFIGLSKLKYTPAALEKSYNSAALSILEDEVNWGRLVAYFTFTGLIAVEMKKRDIERLDDLADWSTAIILTKIQPWIRVNGGWDMFESFENTAWESFQQMMTALVNNCVVS